MWGGDFCIDSWHLIVFVGKDVLLNALRWDRLSGDRGWSLEGGESQLQIFLDRGISKGKISCLVYTYTSYSSVYGKVIYSIILHMQMLQTNNIFVSWKKLKISLDVIFVYNDAIFKLFGCKFCYSESQIYEYTYFHKSYSTLWSCEHLSSFFLCRPMRKNNRCHTFWNKFQDDISCALAMYSFIRDLLYTFICPILDHELGLNFYWGCRFCVKYR